MSTKDIDLPPFKIIHVTLIDSGLASGAQEVKVVASPLCVLIQPSGYNDPKGAHTPVFLRFADGDLFVTIWGDINSDQPTHCISLSGAREDRRR